MGLVGTSVCEGEHLGIVEAELTVLLVRMAAGPALLGGRDGDCAVTGRQNMRLLV